MNTRCLKTFTFALLVSAAMTAPAVADKIGVTAAVNPQVTGTPPGQPTRTLVLGNDVYHDERIKAGSGGLLQVLFVDGTTFTVGPGTELVIDNYIYDPAKGTGQIAATMAKGVLRFVGGKISKQNDAVQINALNGTIGIRGAVVNIESNGGGLGKVIFEFGRSANFCSGSNCTKLYQQGYLLEVKPGPNGVPITVVRKTEPGDITLIQQKLAGKPGKHGGSGNVPNAGLVQQYNVANVAGTPPQTQPQTGGLYPVWDGITLEDVPGLVNPTANVTTQQIQAGNITPVVPPTPPTTGEYALIATGFGSSNRSELEGVISYGSLEVGATGLTSAQLMAGVTNVGIMNLGFTPGGPGLIATTIEVFDSEDNALQVLPSSTAQMSEAQAPICSQCSFLKWGNWSADVRLQSQSGEGTDFVQGRGVWVAGQPIDPANMPVQGTATYNGTAVGMVSNGANTYQAQGGMQMGWNFGTRSGDFSIRNFDQANTGGINVSGSISGEGTGFAGVISSVDSGYIGAASGQFASGPANLDAGGRPIPGSTPQGVNGQFFLGGTGDNLYQAIGVFGGARGD